MKRKISFIVAGFLTVFMAYASAQEFFKPLRKDSLLLEWRAGVIFQKSMTLDGAAKRPEQLYMPVKAFPDYSAAKFPTAVLAGNYYQEQLGIICKQEYKLERATHIPFRFRLGSLDYCNYLEGKK